MYEAADAHVRTKIQTDWESRVNFDFNLKSSFYDF